MMCVHLVGEKMQIDTQEGKKSDKNTILAVWIFTSTFRKDNKTTK